jgi:hypothetical protein
MKMLKAKLYEIEQTRSAPKSIGNTEKRAI